MHSPLTHKERVFAALSHHEPDMVPLSIGSTSNDCFTRVALRKFCLRMGIESYAENVTWKSMGVVETPSAVQERFQADFRCVRMKAPIDPPTPIANEDGSYWDDFGVLMKPSEYYFDPVERPLSGPISMSDIRSFTWPDLRRPGTDSRAAARG